MLLGEFQAEFPWGLLLVTDAASREEIPTWTAPGEMVAAASTALVARVKHQDEGEVLVRVWDDSSEVLGRPVFSGVIELPSGVLKVSDALGDNSIELSAEGVVEHVEIYAGSRGADEVHLVVRSVEGDLRT
ncbi:hypothetical protein [Actinopolymorpha alba]|uniref:hypothetical protein n=1 Tax=Actinopolymorpha alba TaxID=533267 RepID=UPI0012F6F2C1|nr:hypothetical protein [Actinopolymorpha alba]